MLHANRHTAVIAFLKKRLLVSRSLQATKVMSPFANTAFHARPTAFFGSRPRVCKAELCTLQMHTCRTNAISKMAHTITTAAWDAERGGHAVSRQQGVRPKQSLGQNFLRDVNMITRIINAFDEGVAQLCPHAQVVEVGPGLGALTSRLVDRYPDMLAVEIDRRAVEYLNQHFPALQVRHADVLETNWPDLARDVSKPLAVIGNLPYNIVSQILLSLLEAPSGTIGLATVMMQKEVSERITARTRTKAYGILSVVGQLYSRPTILFPVPNTVFYPKPDVTSAMVQFEFKSDPCLDVRNVTLTSSLRKVVRCAFNQRRKVLRNSLRTICNENGVSLPDYWADKRAEEISPPQFVDVAKFLFAKDLEHPVITCASERPITVWR